MDYMKYLTEISNDIFNDLGSGHQETIYHEAMNVEFKLAKLKHESHVKIPIIYKDHYVGIGEIDVVLCDNLIIELKAVKSINKNHKIQLRKYLNVTGIDEGILINFPYDETSPQLEYVTIHDKIEPTEKPKKTKKEE